MIVFLNKEVDIASLDLVAYDSVFNVHFFVNLLTKGNYGIK